MNNKEFVKQAQVVVKVIEKEAKLKRKNHLGESKNGTINQRH